LNQKDDVKHFFDSLNIVEQLPCYFVI
jgi:hypothetical protein